MRLYDKGLIYRGEYIINWCPRCLTALSNEEAEGSDSQGKLHHIRYPLTEKASEAARTASDAGASAISFGQDANGASRSQPPDPKRCSGTPVSLFIPRDERYAALVGERAILPLADREIAIVADEWVDREFGTGMVKVTPAHDPNGFRDRGPHRPRAIGHFHARGTERTTQSLNPSGIWIDSKPGKRYCGR